MDLNKANTCRVKQRLTLAVRNKGVLISWGAVLVEVNLGSRKEA